MSAQSDLETALRHLGASDTVAVAVASTVAANFRAEDLSDAADLLNRVNPDRDVDFSAGVDWAVGELRRLAGVAAVGGAE
ncbi:hypothetical protein [Streptomyces sp. NPDC090022]|uniref:hypothetical protein n=1 Tax=Streptomyces sp. NPDC090022 TaxID=3365920 RepID=UPI0037FC664F